MPKISPPVDSAAPTLRVIRWPRVLDKVAYTRQHVSKLIARGEFPAPVRLGPNSVGFLEHEVDRWIATRPRGPVGRAYLLEGRRAKAAKAAE